jgi:hypothetical protein
MVQLIEPRKGVQNACKPRTHKNGCQGLHLLGQKRTAKGKRHTQFSENVQATTLPLLEELAEQGLRRRYQ